MRIGLELDPHILLRLMRRVPIVVHLRNSLSRFPILIHEMDIIKVSEEHGNDHVIFQLCELHPQTRMPTYAPAEESIRLLFVLGLLGHVTRRVPFGGVGIDGWIQVRGAEGVGDEGVGWDHLVRGGNGDVGAGDVAAETGAEGLEADGVAEAEVNEGKVGFLVELEWVLEWEGEVSTYPSLEWNGHELVFERETAVRSISRRHTFDLLADFGEPVRFVG